MSMFSGEINAIVLRGRFESNSKPWPRTRVVMGV
jgi:hypothetical protein